MLAYLKEVLCVAKAKHMSGLDVQAPTADNARLIARTRLDEMFAWTKYVDDAFHIQELHDMRIAAKRLRYTLEIFEEVLPEAVAPIIIEVTHIQEELGALHDSDVSIALLRLCLGSEDSGIVYEDALANAAQKRTRGKSMLNPELVSYVVNPRHAPDAVQRGGLESLLRDLEQQRLDHYNVFRQHWHTLQARDFRRQVLDAISVYS
jgi:CHAD domain-containing protein